MAAKLTQEEKYMKAAIREAKKAWALGEVPIGCVIVYEDKIIGRGYNRRIALPKRSKKAETATWHMRRSRQSKKRASAWATGAWKNVSCT